MQARRGDLYDESVEWIEYLLSWQTDSYNELINYKKKIDKAYVLKLSEYYLAGKSIENSLGRKRFIKYNKAVLDWQYRKDLLLKVIEIFFKRDILSYGNETYGILEGLNEKKMDTKTISQ